MSNYKMDKAKSCYYCQPLVERNEKLEAFLMWIARDYVELSHDKVRCQRDDYIKRAKELLDELYEDE
jgi:hypothetical protein